MFCGIHLRAISQKEPMNLIHNMCLKIKNLLHISQGPMS